MDILNFIRSQEDNQEISAQLFLVNPTFSFQDRLEEAHKILKSVSEQYKVPLCHIKIGGSAQLGLSLHKENIFKFKSSDLDIAIIDSGLYTRLFEEVYEVTKAYSKKNLFKYQVNDKKEITDDHLSMYKKWLGKGVIHPKYFPQSTLRKDWLAFFDTLSVEYRETYKSISACVFLSENAFKNKQIPTIIERKKMEALKK